MLLSPRTLICGAAAVALMAGAVGAIMASNPPIQEASASGPPPGWNPPDYPRKDGCGSSCNSGDVTLVNPSFCNVTIIHAEARGAFCSGHFGHVDASDSAEGSGNGSGTPGNAVTTTIVYDNDTTVYDNDTTVYDNDTVIYDNDTVYDNDTTVYDNDTTIVYEPIRNGPESSTVAPEPGNSSTVNRGNEETNQRCVNGDSSGAVVVTVHVCNVNVDVIDDSKFEDNDGVDDAPVGLP